MKKTKAAPVKAAKKAAEVVSSICASCKGTGRGSPTTQCDTCLGTGQAK